MKPLSSAWACASLAACLAAGACSDGGAGPASPPFDPFGTEPSGSTTIEPEAPPAATIEQACARACAHVLSLCPAAAGGAECAPECAASITSFPGCEAEFRTFVSCIATAPLTCVDTTINAPACDGASLALGNCVEGGQPTGGGTAPPR